MTKQGGIECDGLNPKLESILTGFNFHIHTEAVQKYLFFFSQSLCHNWFLDECCETE